MKRATPIAVQLISNVSSKSMSPQRVARAFRSLLDSGHRLHADGQAKDDPEQLLRGGYTPKYEIEIFGSRYFLCNQRDAHGLKVIPAYVMADTAGRRGKPTIYARVFYKDSSLVWRSASHYINTADEQWIGKDAVRWVNRKGTRGWFSAEETTNLPFEVQAALDEVSQRGPRKQNDSRILSLILRNAPSNRVWPYQDFDGIRQKAMQSRANRINNNKSIAWFEDPADPRSLKFTSGFEPNFSNILDLSVSRSSMYGGRIEKYRIASRNERIQYLFVAGPTHVWIVNPQALTTELSTYGLRSVDVITDEDFCIPRYEFFDNEGTGEIDSQIPAGFAGDPCPVDPDRTDASPWNEKMPVVKAFRRAILTSRPKLAGK